MHIASRLFNLSSKSLFPSFISLSLFPYCAHKTIASSRSFVSVSKLILLYARNSVRDSSRVGYKKNYVNLLGRNTLFLLVRN